jgi:hypothetical protein
MSMDVTERMEVDVMEVQNQAAYRSWHLAAKESPQAAQIFILLHLAEQWATNMEVGLSREPLEAIAEHVHREVTSGAGWLHLGTPWQMPWSTSLVPAGHMVRRCGDGIEPSLRSTESH